jgi:hypothetical protein
MGFLLPLFLCASVIFTVFGKAESENIVRFSNRDWIVRPSSTGEKKGPGPNNWDAKNVWVDGQCFLHLKLTNRNGQWYCSEIFIKERLGFGRYQFWINGRVDQLDLNVVFGLFNYPTPDVGPDGTTKWGKPNGLPASYTIHPNSGNAGKKFPLRLSGDATSHSFMWRSNSVSFSSNHGHYTDENFQQFSSFHFQPDNPFGQVPQSPLRVHINLWMFQGRPPTDKREVELIVKKFIFTPQ